MTVTINHDRRMMKVRDDVVIAFISHRLNVEERQAKRLLNVPGAQVDGMVTLGEGDERHLVIDPQRVLDDIAGVRIFMQMVLASPQASHPHMEGLTPWALGMIKGVAQQWRRHSDFPRALV